MTDVIRFPQQSDPTSPVPSDWPYVSTELYSATPENSTEGARHVRDLHVRLENVLKGTAVGSGGDQGIGDLVQAMIQVDVAMQERYGKLDLADLLKKNKIVKGKDGLPILSAALGILEKYGRNLLKSNRPAGWKNISFSNAVFRTRVDIIKGARDVLKLLGYTQIVEDGLCFPDHMQAPDATTVAMVTSDLILAKAETEAYSRKTHPHPERVTECVEGTIAAIRYPPSDSNDPNKDGGTVYVRRTSQQQNSRPMAPSSEEQLRRPAVPMGQSSGIPPMQTSRVLHRPPNTLPKPAWEQSSQSGTATARPSATYQSASLPSDNDHLICSMCGQDSATKACNTCSERLRCNQCDINWHGHPERQSHHRYDIFPIIHEPSPVTQEQSSLPRKMCSVCGGNQATQHCQQCDADFCDACGKKMHLHPKRKNHNLQPLPGGDNRAVQPLPGQDNRAVQPLPGQDNRAVQPLPGQDNRAVHRQPPDGRSIRVAMEDRHARTSPVGKSHQAIKRPESFNTQQTTAEQTPAEQRLNYQQLPAADHSIADQQRSPGQQPIPTPRKRPVPKPRKSVGKSPMSPVPPTEFGGQASTASLSTNIGQQQHNEPTSPTSPCDPRTREMQDIMSRDVDLLERIQGLRTNLKSLPRNTPQYTSLLQMESSLWDEHTELLQRQAELERSLKAPPVPMQRGQSMMVDIRRPPVGDKPLSVIPGEGVLQPSGTNRPSTAPSGRSQSTRRSQDAVFFPRPPADGWECIPCGYINDGNRYNCESCGVPYSLPGSNQQQQQRGVSRPQHPLSQSQPLPSYHITPPVVSHAHQAPPDVTTHNKVSNIIGAFDAVPQSHNRPSTQMTSPQPSSPSRRAAQQAKILEAQLPSGIPFGVKTPMTRHQTNADPTTKTKTWVCQFCTIINTMDISVCQMCNKRREIRELSPPSTPKTPVQRQQTETEKPDTEEKHLTAYEYMQLQEEEMLKEKLKAKAEDEAHEVSPGNKGHPLDIQSRSNKTLPGATPVMPPVVQRSKDVRPEPLLIPVRTSKEKQVEMERSVSPGKDLGADSPSSALSPTTQIQLTQERRILAEQATDGLAFINVLRQAETNGFCVEDVSVASRVIQETQSEETIVQWLQQYWDDFKSTATAQATNAFNMPGSSQRIQLSEEEVVEALYKHDGKMEDVVHECMEQRKHKISELESYGFENSQAAKAISLCDGNVDKALMKLQEATVTPMLERLWEKDEEDKDLLEKLKVIPTAEKEHERYLRLLFAEFDIGSWGRARTAAKLIAAGKYKTADAITAASECGDYERAKQFLEKECQVCYGEFPHNQLMSLSHCEDCLICSECLAQHFKVVITTRNIIHATCPACNKPDSKDATELAEYFTFLDTWLRTLLDEETHGLFQSKLRDWNLQKEANFRWCAHCRNGFINEAPERRKMRCPECGKITCFNCKKPWLDQHENITCQQFEQWKQDNDPERQQEGVAYHLRENGIDCPQCKMRYELAKGGCMHFKCTQCMFEFCCGCNKPFLQKAECGKFPSCINKGLHSHHPRDCLFHLRDWDVPQLQKLLDNHKIAYDTQPPQGLEVQQGGCRVVEQKETPEGLNDGPCGREAPALHAGLCRLHYLEYLVGLINQNLIDPADTFDPHELNIVLKRNEIPVPDRLRNETEDAYRKRLLQEVKQKLPFVDKPPRERP